MPWAVRFDSPTALNRPGLEGAWQRTRATRVRSPPTCCCPYGQAAAHAAAPLLDTEPRPPRMIPLPVPIAAQRPPCSAERTR